MITVQFVKLEDWSDELDVREVQEGIVRVVTMPQGEASPTGQRMHVTEAGFLVGDQLRSLILLASSEEAAAAQADQIRKAVEQADLAVRPGRYV